MLREAPGSYAHPRTLIGHRLLHGPEYIALLNPLVLLSSVVEIEGEQTVDVALRKCFAEALERVGYDVQTQKNPTKPLSRKLRNKPVIQFTVEEFDYGFGSSQGAPDTMDIRVTLSVVDGVHTGAIWTKPYQVAQSHQCTRGKAVIRMSVDELLRRVVVADFASAEFAQALRTVREPRSAETLSGAHAAVAAGTR